MLEPYNYSEQESGRSDTLVKAIERIEKLEKQLEVAVKALKTYADERTWYCCFKNQCAYVDGFEANEAIAKIKELEK